jgi:hypothetical protein
VRKFLLYVVLLLPFLVHSQINVPYDIHKKYPVAELQFDLTVLKSALIKTHPGLFEYQSPQQFEEAFSRLYNSIQAPKTEIEFTLLLWAFMSDIRCGHTGIGFSVNGKNYFSDSVKYLPFDLKIIQHRVYIVDNFSTDDRIAPGTEISSINGKNIQLLLKETSPYVRKEGFIEEATEFRLSRTFNFFLSVLYNSPANYQLELVTFNGKRLKSNVASIGDKQVNALRLERDAQKNKEKYSPFRFKMIDSLKTALISIDDFVGKGYERFLKKSFKMIRESKAENLIIDLRHSTGGKDNYGSLLYAYIAKYKFNYYDHLEMTIDDPKDSIFNYGKLPVGIQIMYKFHLLKKEGSVYKLKKVLHPNLRKAPFKPRKKGFRKNVYVLIGYECFSATTEFCAIAHFNKSATFIGQETGGAYCGNNSGDFFELTLPHTGLVAYIPLIRYYIAAEHCPYGRGIQPDYPIEKSIEDFIHKKDVELDFTLDLIRKKK